MKKIISFLICIVITVSLASVCTAVFATGSDNNAVTSSYTQKISINEDDFFVGFRGVIRRIFFVKISFDTDGGTDINNQYTLKFIGKISKPGDPEKEGHTFAGWDKEIPTKARWKDISVKAKWTVNKYKIIFKSNNGTFSDGSTSKEYILEYGKAIKAPSDLTRSGFKFTGWGPRVSDTVKGDAVYDAQWYKNTKYVKTKNYDEFVAETSKLVSKSLSNIDKDAAQSDEYYFGRLIVQADNYNGIDFEELEADEVIYGEDGLVVLQFSSSELAENCADFLDSLTKVSYVEADAFIDIPEDVEVEEIPASDGKNWGKSYINADKYAYYLEQNNFNHMITVAVIDTGVDKNHPLLKNRIMSSGYNSIDDNKTIDDDNGHGTHVAGIIADCTENLSNVKILVVKALDSNGGTLLSIVNAINYAADMNVEVINLSLEGKLNIGSTFIEKAITNAKAKGITVVVAAGNGDPSNNHKAVDTKNICPAYLESTIVVGALKNDGEIAYFSNYGKSVDVCAPGWGIYSGALNGEYKYMCGTSQATPHISAVAVMYKLSHPNYSPDQIEMLIKEYCVDKGEIGRDDYCGEGCPNMYDAIPNCKVAFDTNGGTTIMSKTIKNSSTVVLPTPTKSYKVTLNTNGGSISTSTYSRSCSFDGWYTTSSLSGSSHPSSESYMVLSDQTFYAKWTNNTLGSVNAPTKSGYYFTGWYSAASGGAKYTSTSEISSDVTLYAHWEQYTVTYNANGGSGAPSSTKGYNATTLSSTKPKKSGYQFLGWSTSSSATSPSYYVGSTIYLYSNQTLYAVWGKASITLSFYSKNYVQDIGVKDANDNTVTYLKGSLPTSTYWYKLTLPTVSYSYCGDGTGSTGWVVTGKAGNTYQYYSTSSEIYVNQPGTYTLVYYQNGYSSSTVTLTLSLKKTTSASQPIYSGPGANYQKSTTVASGSTVNITEIIWFNCYYTSTQQAATFGKVTVNGVTGWIIMYGKNDNYS